MQELSPTKVFIPGGLPLATYVSRERLKLEETLTSWIDGAHTSILSVSGSTKSGKTVLLKRFLDDAVWVSGGSVETADEFWEHVCEELELFTEHGLEATRDRQSAHMGEFTADAVVAQGTVSATEQDGASRRITRTRRQTPKAAARAALKAAKPAVVIDDFHYIPAGEQLRIVRGLKDLVFEGLPVVLAAVPHRAYDAVRVEKEMTGRVTSLPIDLWSTEDLVQIANQGFNALDVQDDGNTLATRMAEESFASPHLMQTHCLYLSEFNEVGKPGAHQDLLAPDWDSFFAERASATSKSAFDLLKQGPRERKDRIARTLKSGISTDIYGAVLAAVESTGPRTSLTYEEIRAALRNVLVSDLPQRNEVTNILDQMTLIAKNKIEGEPVLEYDPEYSTLYLADPFFAYYLRWAPSDMKDLSVAE